MEAGGEYVVYYDEDLTNYENEDNPVDQESQ